MNTVEKATLYESFLDQVVQAGLTSGDLMANPHNIRFTGGNTVEIGTVTTSGMVNYDRTNGYTRGAGNFAWTPYVIPYDRGFEFLIDAMDEDESGGNFSAGNVLKAFGDYQEIPEMDTVRYSDIFQSIVGDDKVRYGYYTPLEATLLKQFNTDVAGIRKEAGRTPVLKAKMSESAFAVLTNSTELSKQLMVQSVAGENGVTTEIYKINGVMITPVPDDRLVTEIELITTGTVGGFTTKDYAQEMNWIIYSTDAVVAFEKHKKVKVFAEDKHTQGDGDLIQGRLVHGCWTLKNKKNLIYISLKTATIDAVTGTVAAGSGKVEVTITDYVALLAANPGHTWKYLDLNSATPMDVPACYDDVTTTSWTAIESASKVTVTVTATHYCAVAQFDENGKVIEFTQVAATA